MKLVCDSCGTKYSIGDDRVAGKVFKIRCKKCSHVMVVRGAAAPASEPIEPIVATPSDDWHAVIDGLQSGPFSRVDLLRKHAAGELDHDTFVWREGMADWVALGTLDELRGEATAVTSAPVADAPAARLLNERNESSVLFTLGNLAKLATPTAKATPATASKGTGTEGSGLIDIRALASTFAPAKSTAKSAGTIGSSDDIPVYAPATFGEPIVLMPNLRAKRPDRRLVIALVATLAMLAVLAVVLVLVVLRDPDPTPVAIESPPPTRVATIDPAVAAPTQRPTASPTTTDASPSPPSVAPPAAPATSPAHTPTRTTPSTPTTSRTTPTSRTTSTRTTPTLTTDKEPNSCTDVACAFNNYKDDCCKVFRPGGRHPTPTPTTQPTGQLNENLDRAQLASGIASIKAQACSGRSSARGDVNASVKVSADGQVIGVTILSSPDAALSSCVTAAAQRGTFAKTKRGGSFKYVWRF